MFVLTFGLAIAQVAKYTAKIEELTESRAVYEDMLLNIKAGDKDSLSDEQKAMMKSLHSEIAKLEIQIGLCKQFLEFWKEVLKSGLQILGMFNELIAGR